MTAEAPETVRAECAEHGEQDHVVWLVASLTTGEESERFQCTVCAEKAAASYTSDRLVHFDTGDVLHEGPNARFTAQTAGWYQIGPYGIRLMEATPPGYRPQQ